MERARCDLPGGGEEAARCACRVSQANPKLKLAITEGHLSLQPHNKIELLREWLSGVYHARCMTLFEQHSDIIDICTLADFAGASWTVNAVRLGSPREQPYLLPVGHVMRLFKTQSGTRGLKADSASNLIRLLLASPHVAIPY